MATAGYRGRVGVRQQNLTVRSTVRAGEAKNYPRDGTAPAGVCIR